MSHQPGNISAGTQVVSLIEIRGTNNSIVHPRGVVGVVTRTPAVEGENFLVRFPDGFEKSLERLQLEVLKHFKDRIGANVQEKKVSDSSFDLESCVIYRCVVGSRAYGLDTDESDTDRRGVYLAPPELQWSLFGAPEQFEDNADQSCYWELQKFIIMALRAKHRRIYDSFHRANDETEAGLPEYVLSRLFPREFDFEDTVSRSEAGAIALCQEILAPTDSGTGRSRDLWEKLLTIARELRDAGGSVTRESPSADTKSIPLAD